MLAHDLIWMKEAIQRAQQAEALGEVPIGAILIKEEVFLAEGWNQSITRCDPTAHAELIALRQGAERLHNYRLVGTTLYVTLEPCLMCVGALLHARVPRVVFAAYDADLGALGTRFNILPKLPKGKKFEFIGGILEGPAKQLLQIFFQKRRK